MDDELLLATRVLARLIPPSVTRHMVWADRESGRSLLMVALDRGLIDEANLIDALADELGLRRLERQMLDRLQPMSILTAEAAMAARAAGCALVNSGALNQPVPMLLITPRHSAFARLRTALQTDRQLSYRVRLCSRRTFDMVLRGHVSKQTLLTAIVQLETTNAAQSSRLIGGNRVALFVGGLFVALAGLVHVAQWVMLTVILSLVGLIFLTNCLLRLLAICLHQRSDPQQQAGRRRLNEPLPVYSILVPLRAEAHVVAPLVKHLSALNWPRHRLDIKFIVEADDEPTVAAADLIAGAAGIDVVRVPPCQPRTKPKALNFAMPMVRGELVVVYDAEDRPHPDQLRDVFDAFCSGGAQLACVQAPLQITNFEDNWLTRLFCLEYACHFGGILPTLVRFRLPIPLGGSSNHFRVAALRSVGSWDPYNVTEDADLGVRLARAGWRIDMVSSATEETSVSCPFIWLRQRTRWVKGWLQTWIAHSRHPLQMLAELGWLRFTAVHLFILGSILSALCYPFGVILLGLYIWQAPMAAFSPVWLLGVAGMANFAASHLVVGVLGWQCCTPAARWSLMAALPLLPGYWMMGSIAAWHAVWQLIRRPHHWSKTPHLPPADGIRPFRNRA